MAEQIVVKYLLLHPPFFLLLSMRLIFLIVAREGKRRIYEKHTNIVKVMQRKKTSCDHQPVCFDLKFQ